MRFNRPVRLLAMLSAGLVLAIFITGWFVPGGAELRITPVKGADPLWVGVFKPGERFTIRYYHSVEDSPIWEVHSLDENGRIFIEEERYLKFGAGMGKMPGVGRMVQEGAVEAIVDMHHPVGDFVLRVGSPGVDHTVIWRGSKFNLSALVPHKAVLFSGRPLNWWQYTYRSFFPHPATPQPGGGG